MSSHAEMPSIQILIIGDFQQAEFRGAATALDGCGTVETAANVDEAEAALSAGKISPEAIVVAQSFPGQFSHEAIDRLRRTAPLARILGLMGSWCEGEMRTGRPWPANSRLYWHQWPARCRRQFQRMGEGNRCSFSLPATATEEERLLADLSSNDALEDCRRRLPSPILCDSIPQSASGDASCISNESRTPCNGLAVVRCQSFNAWEMTAEACRHRGMASVWRRDENASIENATVAIFDCDDFNEHELEQLRRLAASVRPAPVIALASFPRIDEQRRALTAGAAAVVSKPFVWDDLFAEVERTTVDNRRIIAGKN